MTLNLKQKPFWVFPEDDDRPNGKYGYPQGVINSVTNAARKHAGREAAASAAIDAVANWLTDDESIDRASAAIAPTLFSREYRHLDEPERRYVRGLALTAVVGAFGGKPA